MIPISEELKQAVLHEVKPKSVEITFEKDNIDHLNWLKEPALNGDFADYVSGLDPTYYQYGVSISPWNFNKLANLDYIKNYNYIIVSFDLTVANRNGTNKRFDLSVYFWHGSNQNTATLHLNTEDYATTQRVYFVAETFLYSSYITRVDHSIGFRWVDSISASDGITIYYGRPQIDFTNDSSERFPYSTLWATDLNIKRYLHKVPQIPIENDHIVEGSFVYHESICSAENLKFGLCEASSIEIDVFNTTEDYVTSVSNYSLAYGDVAEKFEWKGFVVAEAKKSHKGNTTFRHIKSFDRLKNLQENAYSWFTQYMFGMNMDSANPNVPYRFDYERQIFSSYWNLAVSFGIESLDYLTETLIEEYDAFDNETTERYFESNVQSPEWSYPSYSRVRFSKKTIIPDDNYSAYIVRYDPYTCKDAHGKDLFGDAYKVYFDELGRGIRNVASVYVDFHCGDKEYRQLFDNGDCFVVPPNCTSFDVYVPHTVCNSNFADWKPSTDSFTSYFYYTLLARNIQVYGVTFDNYDPRNIKNAYNYYPCHKNVQNPTVGDIITVSSGITARDVLRSLLEICGCFYRIGRNGKPQFFYASEHGLYPSNTLYPSDNLFPKKSSEITMPTSYYINEEFEEYRVEKFGGIQVVISETSNFGSAVVWEYWEDESSNNAYIIDDNIFLCSSDIDPSATIDSQDDYINTLVLELLGNAYEPLDNMQYTPFNATTIGTPFLEAGDRFTLLTKSDGFESFIFERTLKGINALKDYFEARGEENTPRVKTFSYKERR